MRRPPARGRPGPGTRVHWDMALESFHPAVANWFRREFTEPTPCQAQAWPAIRAGHHTLIAAPTGSGKTLAAFLCAIDELLRVGIEGGLPDATMVLYVSPLKALSNDVQKNLQQPLAGVRDQLLELGMADVDIRAQVRTGDTPPAERERMRRVPPHILVTTPESLYLLLTSESGRAMLSTVRTVIVDEIHALAPNKRGAHLALSLQRLAALTPTAPVRIGLSATQKPLKTVADFLVGDHAAPRTIVDIGHVRARDIAIEVTASPLEPVMPGEAWTEIYDRLATLVGEHRTTLIFVNTRRMAERVARHLAERIGDDAVTSHHGSLAREHRFDAEQRLKAGTLRALVATASLELGIDIGDVELVCQLGSPRRIDTLLQRVGRSGHGIGRTPKGRLFPTTRDELVECVALLDAVRRAELERLRLPARPLDVLAQQIVAEVAAQDWSQDELYRCFTGAWVYRDLPRQEFDRIVDMVAQGFTTRRGRRGAYLHHDAVHRQLRSRRGARLTALTNGGAIPDQFDYDVILEPDGHFVGTLNEDFAFESLAGDIFQLGNTSYRILRVERSRVRVEDAKGLPPNIPFWFGEAPGRSDELSSAVSALRAGFAGRWRQGRDAAMLWLNELGFDEAVAGQVVDYLGAAHDALGLLPTHQILVMERFFDEAGDTHLVIHSPFGSRLNRAFGLALRKRFCRRFNFELQAAALEDSIVLSLGSTHSFPLEEVTGYLSAETVRDVLVQALLDAPMFAARWRWIATTALAVRRNRNGQRVPPQLQRMDAEDLIAVVFPDQLACAENLQGARDVPDHPLVRQTVDDCLHDAMDIDGLERLLRGLADGSVTVKTCELTMPSPLASEILTARPYAFLDDAPAEERRTSAVLSRSFLDPETAATLGRLDPEAVAAVRAEAWPDARSEEELHDALVVLGGLTGSEVGAVPRWIDWCETLAREQRATCLALPGEQRVWVAAERLHHWQSLHPGAVMMPPIHAVSAPTDHDVALVELLRSRLEGTGPVTEPELCAALAVPLEDAVRGLAALQVEGFAMRGHYGGETEQWCERRLLARIHRYTMQRLRREIEPVTAAEFMQFLFEWQRVDDAARGEGIDALRKVLGQLEGFPAPARAWESAILAARVRDYSAQMLDQLSLTGEVQWLRAPGTARPAASAPVRSTPICLVPRTEVEHWRLPRDDDGNHSARARQVLDTLQARGALFFDELVRASGMLVTDVELGLQELVAKGLATADGFGGLRQLQARRNRRPNLAGGGRWSRVPTAAHVDIDRRTEHIARVLLRRYGVVLRKLMMRESDTLPPWRELLKIYRRMEARGELRGGRFVAGFSGEQFALPEAVGLLREVRRRGPRNELVSVSATDPLNLVGIVVPGERVPATSTNRVLFRDGAPVAVQYGKQVHFLAELEPAAAWNARNALIARPKPALSGPH